MELMSKRLEELRSHYQVIVVGSGYGGAIAASRLARAHAQVAVLERGRELHPGEYPDTAEAAATHLQFDTPFGEVGDPRNLYRFHVGDQINVFSGCGLGGTSLVNANVSLRADRRVFEDPRWPAAIRGNVASVDRGYDRAETILEPRTYPSEYPSLDKIAALRASAGRWPCTLTPINVRFHSGPNHVGVHQERCTGCGDCATGCNVGAKNTVLMNYLPDAVANGAEIFTEIEVQSVSRGERGWIVHVQPLGPGRGRRSAAPRALSADVVVLAAGTLGTTGILLRSPLSLSSKLGKRFTGNGDVLGFSYAAGRAVNGCGAGDRPPDPDHPAGPCITAMIDRRHGVALDDAMIVEDAVIPGALAPFVPAALAGQALPDWLRGRLGKSGPLGLVASMLTHGRRGMLANTETFLLMGHDDDEGSVVLRDGRVRIEWPGAGTSAFYTKANAALREAAGAEGGTYLRSPIWSRLLHHDLLTVHPLGGCVMADRAEDGVVDHLGRVFAGTTGDAVHEGLYVWDGSIVPMPLGVNPLLTISALAERAASALVEAEGWQEDQRYPAPALAAHPDASAAPVTGAPAPPARPGLRFSEHLAGFWSKATSDERADAHDVEQYLEAAKAGEEALQRLSFVLTITTDDVAAVEARLDRTLEAVGTVGAPELSPDPLTVQGGTFQFKVCEPGDPPESAVCFMRYRLPLVAVDGSRYFFDGFKILQPGDLTDLWPDSTTLYVTLRADSATGQVVGRGVLHISPGDFARQLTTLQITGPVAGLERLRLLGRFGRFFAGALLDDYGRILHRVTSFHPSAPRRRRRLDVPGGKVYPYTTEDGVHLRLTRYQGGSRGPVVLSHGMGANPLTFTLDTVKPNLLEFLVDKGFDVWVQEWRGSTLLETAHSRFDADQVAHRDHPAAADVVRRETNRSDIHWVTHCVGSITSLMATLAGTITPASLLCSQVGLHPVAARLTRIKIHLHLGKLLWGFGVRYLTTDSFVGESVGAQLTDQLLRFYPVPHAERCTSAVCRRLAFIYGIAVHHPAVDARTHGILHELFGVTNLDMMNHLAKCAEGQRLVSAKGEDVYLPHLDRLQLPITFLHGAANLVWLPESTELTVALLEKEFDPGLYRRVSFDSHGHQDTLMGAESPRDAFPAVLEHLDRVNA